MNPHRLTYGFAYDFPFAQLVAIATLAGLGWHAMRNRGLRGFLASTELKLLLTLWLVFTITSIFALQPDEAWNSWNQITKIVLMAFLTAFLIDDEKKLRYLLITIAFSMGFFGIKGGIFSILSGGQFRVWGPEGSFIEDNNALALALNMTLPILYFLGKTEPRKWLRNLFYISFVLTVLSIVFTYSRGGFVGLLVVMFCIFLTTRFRSKIIFVALGILAFPVVVSQLPDTWTSRMTSIQTYQQDGSALSRLHAWTAAWRLALDRPLIGGGFQAINNYDVFIRYNPEILEEMKNRGNDGLHVSGVHSIYFELLAENGFPGLFAFLVLCLVLILSLNKLASKKSDRSGGVRVAYGQMLRTSLLAYLATGTFLELASFDFFYQIVALTVVAKRIYLQSPNHLESTQNSVGEVRQPTPKLV